MRTRIFGRALVALTATAGIATASLAGAQAGLAAATPAHAAAAGPSAVLPHAVVNLGLSTTQAQGVQCWLHNNDWGYNGPIDGALGTQSWQALQRYLKFNGYYGGSIDGIVGSGTVSALQESMRNAHFYSGPIDGIAGAQTQAGFRLFANDIREEC